MFITFEGIDGCGKSTQLGLVRNHLVELGYDVISLREPGGTVFAEKIRELLLHSEDKLTPQTELFLFEAARSDLVNKVIKPALSEGKIVLSDRFYDSTTAYQGFGRLLPVETIIKINELATETLKPDITFYLNVSLETSELRTAGKAKDKIEISGNGFYSRVVNGFKTLCENEPDRFFEIDAEGNIEETLQKILKMIKNNL